MRRKLVKLINLIHSYLDLWLARAKPRAYPTELSIGTTSYCNLKCVQCPREGHDGNRIPFDEHLELEYYQRLEPLLRRAKEVSLYGLGEPMIDRNYFEKVRYVNSFGAQVSLSTNGTLLDERRCRELIESGIKSVGISLDAARDETFARVRPPGGLPKILENIKRLTRMKEELGIRHPMLRLSYGIMPPNVAELSEFPKLAAEVGCEEIIVHPVIFMSADKRRELAVEKTMMDEAVERARLRAEELHIPFYYWELDPMTYLRSLQYARESAGEADPDSCTCRTQEKPHFCFFLWRNAMIQGHGELFPCCYMTNVHLGVLENGHSTEWRSHPFLAELRQKLFEGDLPDPCAHCPQLYPYDRAVILRSAFQEIRNLIRS